jgi:SPP1 gp7 family putative phage head morphogenesis protein
MIQTFGREALKAALFAQRKKMGKATRGHPKKPTRWLYPWTTERHYAAAIRAWLRPMKEYVHQYIKNNQEAILRGDSAALVRQDATPGGSYRRMVKSLIGWQTTYLPPLTSNGTRDAPPVVFMGLGNIAESINDFNGKQWENAAKAELGVEFPVYETWWPDTKQVWQEQNYELIHDLSSDYVKRVNQRAEQAITSGWSPAQLAKQIQKIDQTISGSRVNLIARDQIGKLNGQVTQARMEAVGLELYEWSTSSDERVRDSHAVLEGKICRWDDSAIYSDDGGKTWKDRPSDWCQLHPGQDIQCRCTALSYWSELVNEVDEQIDLLTESVDNIPQTEKEGLLVMNLPSIQTKNEIQRKAAEVREERRRQTNAKKAQEAADQLFPSEKWMKVDDGIYLSPRRPVGKKSNYADEKRDAEILRSFGSTVYLTPEARGDGLKKYDAIVNGLQMEFKNIHGSSLSTLQEQFLKSRSQAPNVFINMENSSLTKKDIISSLYGARNNARYGKKNVFSGGRILLKIKGHKNLIYLNVDSLKIKRQ